MINVSYEVDQASLKQVQQKLGDMKSKAPTVIARGLNQTAVTARQDLAEKAQESYTVKTGKFKSNMKISKAYAGNLEAIIRSNGKPLNITNFKSSKPKKSAAKADITKTGLKAIEMSGIKAFGGKNGLIWQRRSKARLPIKPLKSNSIPKMIEGKRVFKELEPKIQETLQKEINRQIKLLVEG